MDNKNKKVQKRKEITEKRTISVFEISIMLISVFAFAFIIAEASGVFGSENIGIGLASAQETGIVTCCEKSMNGTWCYDTDSESNCDSNYQINPNALCSQTSFCKLGCCYDNNEGTCARNSVQTLCAESNGQFSANNPDCNIQQCKLGCCIIGDGASYVTEQQCKKKAEYYGMDYATQATFKSSGISNELQCLAMAGMSDKGACVYENSDGERTCSFKTREECLGSTGIRTGYEFYNDMLCTASSLNTTCLPTQKTTCLEDKDEIYFVDSCGNAANIYDSSKVNDEAYWTYYKTKEESCGATSTTGNANSASCGNCDYLAGSKCKAYRQGMDNKPDYGSYVCRDLNCYDTSDNTDRKHGESWCEYDGSIGNGTDVVGSRHWRHYCLEGEEKVEPCEDYRQEICAEQQVEAADGSSFSNAQCVANEWRECLSYNADESTAEENCKANQHCFWQAVWDPKEDGEGNLDAGVVYTCLPQYPPGNYLMSEATQSQASSSEIMCSLASQSVTVTEVKKCKLFGIFGSKWKCVANCITDEEGWTQAMNKWCTSLGDCGAYVNIAGEVTEGGYEIDGGTPLSDSYLDSLQANIIPNPEVKGRLSSGSWEGGSDDTGWTGAVGALGGVAMIIGNWQKIRTFVGISTRFGGVFSGVWSNAFIKGAVAAAAAYFAGQIIGKLFGLTSKDTETLSYVGVATAIGYSIIAHQVGWEASFSYTLFWAAVVMIALAIISKLAGCGKKREHTVTFTCKPWQQPSGGAKCGLCDDELSANGLHECSEYRCESLGAACRLKDNAGSAVCWWENQGDVASPVITPWQDALTDGYSYASTASCPTSCANEIRYDYANDGCVPYNTPIQFGITTDEPANCRIDSERTNSFEDMQSSLSGGAYLQEHSTIIATPSSQSIAEEMANAIAVEEGEEPDEESSSVVTILDIMAGQENRVYIRCQDFNGNTNVQEMTFEFCVSDEPDATAPLIMRISPESMSGVAYGTDTKDVELFLNEPSDCRWSNVDMDYDLMENNLSCDTSTTAMQADGTYRCRGTLIGISSGQDNLFYFRCKDHPFSVNESERNANTQGYEYILKGTSALNITSISPIGLLTTGIEPMSIELYAKTSGGMDNGNAACTYTYRGMSIDFFNTGETEHKQQLSLMGGNYSYNISCEDTAGNVANANIAFNISIDKTAPSVVRAYYDAGQLKVLTNEDALCRYSTNSTLRCGFEFNDTESSTAMSVLYGKMHTASWATDRRYYIKCKDAFGNNPGSNICSIEARAIDLTP